MTIRPGKELIEETEGDVEPARKGDRVVYNIRIFLYKGAEVPHQRVKTLPYAALSHPFVERLIGTMRREYLDHVFFWNVADLEKKLAEFQVYFNRSRVHSALDGHTPTEVSGVAVTSRAKLHSFRWQTHCRGLYQLPVTA